MQAAERCAYELRRANPNISDYIKARDEAEHKVKSHYGQLIKAKEKIVLLENELKAEKGRSARLEASLPTTEAGEDLSSRQGGIRERYGGGSKKSFPWSIQCSDTGTHISLESEKISPTGIRPARSVATNRETTFLREAVIFVQLD